MPESNRRQKLIFTGVTVAFILLSAFFWRGFPTKPMVAFPGILGLTTTMPILFYFIATQPRARAKQIAGISSCLIWVVGIALAFAIKPDSNFIFIPDAMLMLGFFPLLYLWRFSWTWIIFGIFNCAIGMLLYVIEFSPDSLFPADLLMPKHHLADYHPPIVWMTTGALATIFGVGRLAKNIYLMMRKARSAA